jgi:hypothetical protein
MSSATCPHCRATLTHPAAFCYRCGRPIASSTVSDAVAVLASPKGHKTYDQIEYETTLKDQRGCFIATWAIIIIFGIAICIGSYWNGQARVEEEKKLQLESVERMRRDGTIPRDYVKELQSSQRGSEH